MNLFMTHLLSNFPKKKLIFNSENESFYDSFINLFFDSENESCVRRRNVTHRVSWDLRNHRRLQGQNSVHGAGAGQTQ